ncbi:MAG: 3-oxoacyl-[acyl-carrier-protein] reductase [Rhodospirillaceae bacterium]|nr:3-oxoacyl-[acyl-carrier-protein] reductase [Rhodospirillaceae bacterium]MCY4237280.1 3-oxoacyl-[acyl-carrier-protein] reductase [Rhodospirillaceae bacterium]
MFDLSGKTALVTGASGGIGSAIARALHAQGAAVALSGRRKDALDALARALGERTHVMPADLNEPEQTDALISLTEEALGDLHILVNNAGLARDMLSMRLSDEQWRNVIEVNLTSVFRLSRAALRNMVRRRYGRVINMTSVVGVTGNPGQANYAASKAGMIGMTKSMAAEVAARGITLNCIAPGFIKSDMTDILNDKQKATIIDHVPVGKIGDPEDIGAAAVYLASDEAAYVTGQTLHVNGGMAMI